MHTRYVNKRKASKWQIKG